MKIILIAYFLMLGDMAAAQQSVNIKGHIQNLEGSQLIVSFKKSGKRVSEKIKTVNEKFECQLSIDEIQEVSIYPYRFAKNSIRDTVNKFYYSTPGLVLFVAPGDQIEIQGDALKLWSAGVKGGKFEKEYTQFRLLYDQFIAKGNEIKLAWYDFLKKGDANGVALKKKEHITVTKESDEVVKKFFTEKTDNVYALFKFLKEIKSLQHIEAEKIYESYSTELKQSEIGKKVNLFLAKSKMVGAGTKMIDFNGTALDGKPFDSKSLRGKYILLDFWGSWCKPCRKSNPHLKELYAQYKNKDFEIVGIAYEMAPTIEKAKRMLQKAVEQDGLSWVQLLNMELEQNLNVIEAYNVGAYPTKILIDREGKIIWRGVGSEGDDLDKLLVDIFHISDSY